MGWRLEGAIARYLAVTGAPRDAMARQSALTQVHVETLSHAEASFPLAEWLRLAGVLDDREAFAQADAMRAELQPMGAFGLAGSAYVELARERAALRLGLAERATTLERLHGLATDVTVASHVRWSAARAWLDAAGEAETGSVADALARAAADADQRRGHAARTGSVLVTLDAALARGATTEAEQAVARLTTLEPGILHHLRGACGESGLPEYVATFYPY